MARKLAERKNQVALTIFLFFSARSSFAQITMIFSSFS